MILCDTNIFIQAFNGDQKTTVTLSEIGLENILLSSVTVMELYQGMGNKNELAQMKSRIKYFDVLEIDLESSRLAVALVEQYNLSHGLVIPDALIAASAITHNIDLFTYNEKDFKFLPGVKLYQ